MEPSTRLFCRTKCKITLKAYQALNLPLKHYLKRLPLNCDEPIYLGEGQLCYACQKEVQLSLGGS